ncbi:MAG: hypothetical protein QOH46_1040, partial [Solirubrobacteraceae bacterium]|nr:hypothetical protein [Solirubrobacteraceae bacterium]
ASLTPVSRYTPGIARRSATAFAPGARARGGDAPFGRTTTSIVQSSPVPRRGVHLGEEAGAAAGADQRR